MNNKEKRACLWRKVQTRAHCKYVEMEMISLDAQIEYAQIAPGPNCFSSVSVFHDAQMSFLLAEAGCLYLMKLPCNQ